MEEMENEVDDPKNLEVNLSRSISIIERELGFFVDEEYPLMKFFNQLEEITYYKKLQEKEYKKQKRHKGAKH